jgi:hypothetical protein
MFEEKSSIVDLVWQLLLDPSKVTHFVQAEDPRQRSRWGVGGIVNAHGAPGHMDCCGTRKSDSPVRAS